MFFIIIKYENSLLGLLTNYTLGLMNKAQRMQNFIT